MIIFIYKHMKKNGFAPVLIILAVLVLGVIGYFAFTFSKNIKSDTPDSYPATTTNTEIDNLANKYSVFIDSFLQKISLNQDFEAYSMMADEAKINMSIQNFSQSIDLLIAPRSQKFNLDKISTLEVELNGNKVQVIKTEGILGDNAGDTKHRFQFQLIEPNGELKILYLSSLGFETKVYESP